MIRKAVAGLTILGYLGSLLFIFGLLMVIPALVHLIFPGPGYSLKIFLAFALPGLAVSALGLMLTKKIIPGEVPSVQDGMIITALAWLTVSLTGTIPLVLLLDKYSFIDIFFETTSGFTATGMSLFKELDLMPPAVLFWRSFTQWIGGIGILTFFLAVSFRGGSTAATLFVAENHKINASRPVPGIFNTIKIIWTIYAAMTVAAFLLLWLEGLPLFDALNHTLTLVSTGGFSTHDASIAYFGNFKHSCLIEYTMIAFMLMGGTNFLLHYKVGTGDWRALYRDYEMRLFWLLIGGAGLLIWLNLAFAHGDKFIASGPVIHDHLRGVLFQTVSLITSTGYTVRTINDPFYPALARQVFLMLMFIGGCVGSTAGGFKVLRVGILWQTLTGELKQLSLSPQAIIPLVIQKKLISQREIQRICALLFAWIALVWTGTAVTLACTDLNLCQAFSGMLSAVSNMGPAFFTPAELGSFPFPVKFSYIFGMLAGRLEVLPVFVFCVRLVRH